MKFRYSTDIHYAETRASFRKNRISEQGLSLLHQSIVNRDTDTAFFVNGGDLVQFERSTPTELAQAWMRAVVDEYKKSGLPFHVTVGNYDIERFGGLKQTAKFLDIPEKSYYFDHDGQHRVIVLNQEFQAVPNDQTLYPWSDENLELVRQALHTAPSKSVTIFAHSPCDDFDWQQASTTLRGYNVSNNYRPNSSVLREIMEESGQNILFVAGHTHIEVFDQHKNVKYITVQGMTEVISKENGQPYGRWIDVHRIGEDQIDVRVHGYKPHSLSWHYADNGDYPTYQPVMLLAAE
ncbi:MAG: metallophosphoesterase family protein [Alphaproteobacteria bacterium]